MLCASIVSTDSTSVQTLHLRCLHFSARGPILCSSYYPLGTYREEGFAGQRILPDCEFVEFLMTLEITE